MKYLKERLIYDVLHCVLQLAYWETHLGIDFERSWRVTIDGQASEGLVIGLYPNTPYYFAVYVWNEAGNGPKSEHFQQRTLRHGKLDRFLNF